MKKSTKKVSKSKKSSKKIESSSKLSTSKPKKIKTSKKITTNKKTVKTSGKKSSKINAKKHQELLEELQKAYAKIKSQTFLINNLKNKNTSLLQAFESKETNSSVNELKTLQTKVIKLKPKDKIELWRKSTEEVQSLVKFLKEILEIDENEKNFDNLEIEVSKASSTAYHSSMSNLLQKGKMYAEQLKILIEDKREMGERLRNYERQTRELRDSQGFSFEEVKEVFNYSEKSTEFYNNLQRACKENQYVNMKQFQLKTNDSGHYLEGIRDYHKQQNQYYQSLLEQIKEMSSELKRLKKFENNVKSGEIKVGAEQDFKGIFQKLQDHNERLKKLKSVVLEEEFKEQEKKEVPENVKGLIFGINEEFYMVNKQVEYLMRVVEDLLEEKKKSMTQVEKIKNQALSLEIQRIKNLAKKNQEMSNSLKEIIIQEDPNSSMIYSEAEIPNEQKEIIIFMEEEQLEQRTLNKKIQILISNFKDEIERLKIFQEKSEGLTKQNLSINDLKYVLQRNLALNKQTCQIHESITGSSAQKVNFEVSEENPENYVKVIKEVIRNISDLQGDIDEEYSKLKMSQKEQEERVLMSEQHLKKEIVKIHQKMSQYLKDQHYLNEKYNIKQEYQITPLEESQSVQQSAKVINQMIEAAGENTRKLDDQMEQLKFKTTNLEQFQKDVVSGKDKKHCLEDYKKFYEVNMKTLTELKDKSSLIMKKNYPQKTIFVDENDPESLLESTVRSNQEMMAIIKEIGDENNKNQEIIKKLEIFKEEVENGKNKTASLKDYDLQLNQNISKYNKICTILDLIGGEKIDRVDFEVDQKNPQSLLEQIKKSEDVIDEKIYKISTITRELKRDNDAFEKIKNQNQGKIMQLEIDNQNMTDQLQKLNYENKDQKRNIINNLQAVLSAQIDSRSNFKRGMKVLGHEVLEEEKKYDLMSENPEYLLKAIKEQQSINQKKHNEINQIILSKKSVNPTNLAQTYESLRKFRRDMGKRFNDTTGKNFEEYSYQIKDYSNPDELVEGIKQYMNQIDLDMNKFDNEVIMDKETLKKEKEEIRRERDEYKNTVNDLTQDINKMTGFINVKFQSDQEFNEEKEVGQGPDFSQMNRQEKLKHDMKRAFEKMNRKAQEIRERDEKLYSMETQMKTSVNVIPQQEIIKTETKVIQIPSKPKVREWKNQMNEVKELVHLLQTVSNKSQGIQEMPVIEVNLQEETEEEIEGEIQKLMARAVKLGHEMNLVVNEKLSAEKKISQITTQLKNSKEIKGEVVDQLRNILHKTHISTEYLNNLYKAVDDKNLKQFSKIEVNSDEPAHYCLAMNQYFDQHQEYYESLMGEIKDQKSELKRLKKLEEDIGKGLVKVGADGDFKEILLMNRNLQKNLVHVQNQVLGEEGEVNIDMQFQPQTEAMIFAIKEDINKNMKISQNIQRAVSDNQETMKSQGRKITKLEGMSAGVSAEDLANIQKNINTNGLMLKDILTEQVPDISIIFNIKNKQIQDPDQQMIEILNKTIDQRTSINRLQQMMNLKDDEIMRLKEFEKRLKSGEIQDQALSDLKYVLKRNKVLNNQACQLYYQVTKEKPERPNFVPKEANSNEYVMTIKEVINHTSGMFSNIDGYFIKLETRVDEVERDLKNVENKYVKEFMTLNEKSKENFKQTHLILSREKAVDDNEQWKSTLMSDDEEIDKIFDQTKINQDKVKFNLRHIEDLIQKLKGEKMKLNQFKKDVEQGLNKEFCLEDYQNFFKGSHKIKEESKEAAILVVQKPYGNNTRFTDEKDVDSLIESINLNNEESLQYINDLKLNMRKDISHIKELERFKNSIESGKNKDFALTDYQYIYEENVDVIEKMEKVLNQSPELLINRYQVKEDLETPQQYLMEIRDSYKYIKDHVRNSKEWIDQLLIKISKQEDNLKQIKERFRESDVKNQEINKQLRILQDYKQSIDSGMNKKPFSQDLANVYSQNKKINQHIADMIEKLTGKSVKIKDYYVDDENPETYLIALNQQTEDLLEKVFQFTNDQQKEKKKFEELEIFKLNVETGKNKEGAVEDFKHIFRTNVTQLNEMSDIIRKISPGKAEEIEGFLSEKEPTNAQECLEQIQRTSNYMKKYIQTLQDRINDLHEGLKKEKMENKDLNKKIQNSTQINTQLENQLKEMHTKINDTHSEIKQSKDIRGKNYKIINQKSSENLIKIFDLINQYKSQSMPQEVYEDYEGGDLNNSQLISKAIVGKLDKGQSRLVILETIMKSMKTENDRLRDYQKEIKTGANKQNCIGDFQRIYESSNNTLEIAKRVYNSLGEMEFQVEQKEVDVTDAQNLIQGYNDNNDQTDMILNQMKILIKDLMEDHSKFKIFYDEVKGGKNKEAALNDFVKIYSTNTKYVEQLKEMLDEVGGNGFSDQIKFEYKQGINTPEEYLEEIEGTNQVIRNCIRALNKKINEVQDQLRDGQIKINNLSSNKQTLEKQMTMKTQQLNELETFKEEVVGGKGKKYNMGDYQRMYENQVLLNHRLKDFAESIGGGKFSINIEIDDQNPDSILDGFQELNKFNLSILDSIKDQVNSQKEKIKNQEVAIEKFKSGEDKSGQVKTYQNIYDTLNSNMKTMSSLVASDSLGLKSKFKKYQPQQVTSPDGLIKEIMRMNQHFSEYIKMVEERLGEIMGDVQRMEGELAEKNRLISQWESKYQALMSSQGQGDEVLVQKLAMMVKQQFELEGLINQSILSVSKGASISQSSIKVTQDKESLISMLEKLSGMNMEKFTQLQGLIKEFSGSASSQSLMSILNQMDQLKQSYGEVYSNCTDQSFSGWSMSVSGSSESSQIIQAISMYIQSFSQSFSSLQSKVTTKINNLAEAKKQILMEKNKLQDQVEDMNKDIQKKATLIGRLQVKVYMLISMLDFIENKK